MTDRTPVRIRSALLARFLCPSAAHQLQKLTDLARLQAKFRVTDSKVHPCPVKPEASTRSAIAGESAIVFEEHCPADGGPFVLQAFTTHAGQVYVFFTYDQPGNEAEMREWFGSLLQDVSFGA